MPQVHPSVVSNPFWTVSRGEQTINCEFVVASQGPSILRCGYGPHAVIRSQFIASQDAAAALSETWKAALMLQGFRVLGTPLDRC
jgi:hypothetical protein